MYVIYADDRLLFAPDLSDEGYAVTSPKLEVELNKAGSAKFTLPPNNVMYDHLQKLKTEIYIYDDDEELFHGRVLQDEKNFYNQKSVLCEGELAFFLDSIVRPYSFQGSVADLVKQFIDNHNSQVDEWKQFQFGQVTVTDPNDYIVRESNDYPNSFDEMNAKLIDLLGGYLRPRINNGIRYLDYVSDYGSVSDQIIEFGKNLLDITEYISATDVFTVLIPLGAEQQDEEGNLIGRLTISDVNGHDYIEDSNAISLFGRITKVQIWDDVTIAENLLAKAKQYLAQGIEMAVSLTIKAVDMHLLDVDTDRIRLGDYVRVVSLPHGIDKYFLCSKISYDLVNPQNTEYTLGVTFTSLTERQVSQQKSVQSAVSVVQSATQSAQNSASQANETLQQIGNTITQIPTEYVKTATFEAYKQEMNKKITAVYRFKGSVANYDALPSTGMEIGDTYNMLDTGANYAWSDMGWDKLSETLDLSGYAMKEEIPDVPAKVSDLENDLNYMSSDEIELKYTSINAYNELAERVKQLEDALD